MKRFVFFFFPERQNPPLPRHFSRLSTPVELLSCLSVHNKRSDFESVCNSGTGTLLQTDTKTNPLLERVYQWVCLSWRFVFNSGSLLVAVCLQAVCLQQRICPRGSLSTAVGLSSWLFISCLSTTADLSSRLFIYNGGSVFVSLCNSGSVLVAVCLQHRVWVFCFCRSVFASVYHRGYVFVSVCHSGYVSVSVYHSRSCFCVCQQQRVWFCVCI